MIGSFCNRFHDLEKVVHFVTLDSLSFLEFLGGRGVQNKNPSVGGVWIFSGTAHCSV